jgi:hypothetical protein
MTFKTERVLLGVFEKVSKKTGKQYVVLNYLNDNGTAFSSMLADGVKLPEGLQQLDDVIVEFEVQFFNGNVTGLRTIDIKLV